MEHTFSRRTVMKAAGSITPVSLAPGTGAVGDTEVRVASHRPMRAGRFKVEIDDVEVPGWRRVTIPSSYTEQAEYREGETPDSETRVWSQTTFDDLEMERGLQPDDTHVFDWREEIRMGNVDDGRKEVAVALMDEEGADLVRWEFEDAWIREYHPPTLDASADGDVATESIAVAFDTMRRDLTDEPLESAFTIEPSVAGVGEEVTFDASDSEPTEAIDGYEWAFGDGTTATGETVTHTYERAGEYVVELTVEGDGEPDTAIASLEVVERTLDHYADDDGIVRSDGFIEAFVDWREGAIETELLLEVIDAWCGREPVG